MTRNETLAALGLLWWLSSSSKPTVSGPSAGSNTGGSTGGSAGAIDANALQGLATQAQSAGVSDAVLGTVLTLGVAAAGYLLFELLPKLLELSEQQGKFRAANDPQGLYNYAFAWFSRYGYALWGADAKKSAYAARAIVERSFPGYTGIVGKTPTATSGPK